MTPHDLPAFSVSLAAMADTYGAPMSKARIKSYFERLADFDLPRVLQAMNDAIDTCEFFPTIAAIRKILIGDAEQLAIEDWTAVRREINHVGWPGQPRLSPTALQTVMTVFGGWVELCSHTNIDKAEKAFLQAYPYVLKDERRALTTPTPIAALPEDVAQALNTIANTKSMEQSRDGRS